MRHARIPDLGLRRHKMLLAICLHPAVREPHERSTGRASLGAFTDIHQTAEKPDLDPAIRAGLIARDGVVGLRHEPVVAGLIGPACKDVRHFGIATAPAAALPRNPGWFPTRAQFC